MLDESETCPLCGKETGNINNHVRMSNGAEHGPQGSYPDGWDKATRTIDVDDDDETGEELELEDDDDQEDELADPETELVDDDPSEAREYNCGNCDHPLDYLGGDDRDEGGKECPECGERLYWHLVE